MIPFHVEVEHVAGAIVAIAGAFAAIRYYGRRRR